MSDNVVAKWTGESAEQVAFKLLMMVGEAEKKLYPSGQVQQDTDRKWVLDTYSECLAATRGHR